MTFSGFVFNNTSVAGLGYLFEVSEQATLTFFGKEILLMAPFTTSAILIR